jgi:glucose/mannose-6-phosphate isomerase
VSASIGRSPLFDLAAALPEHLAHGAAAGRELEGLPQAAEIETVLILGMGTARIAGQVVRAVGAGGIPVPLLVESCYEIPACVGKGSLVLALSGSGNTDEVNHAAAKSIALGARLVAITSAGWLVDLARDCQAPVVHIPPGVKPARATFGIMAATLLATLESIGLLPEAGSWIKGAISQLRRRRDELLRPDNASERLAALLVERHVVFQGDTPIGAVAAERWKAQFNQNARQSASASAQPDASHNEVMAWDCQVRPSLHSDSVVFLRHPFEDPRVSTRIDQLASYVSDRVPVHSVCAEGDGCFAALMDLAMMGDFTSLHLAAQRGIDPLTVPAISKPLSERFTAPEH